MITLTPSTEIVCQIETPKQFPEVWKNFDVAFDNLHYIFTQLEDADEVSNLLDLEQLKDLRKILTDLALIGSSRATYEEKSLLQRDIVELFTSEEDEIDFHELPSTIYKDNAFMYELISHHATNKGFFKKVANEVRHEARKVKKFVKKHKKELLIGGVVVIGVGVAGFAAAAVCGPAVVAAATAAAATGGSDNIPIEKPPEPPPFYSSAPVIDVEATLIEATPIYSLPDLPTSYPTPFECLKTEAKEMAAFLTHDIWDGIGVIGAGFLDLTKAVNPAKSPSPFESGMSVHEGWQDCLIPAGHEKIDEWFSTSQSTLFNDPNRNMLVGQPIQIGLLPPPPLSLLQKVGEVKKIAQAIQGEEALIVGEIGLNQRRVNPAGNIGALENRIGAAFENAFIPERPLIIKQPNGIWELNGKHIKSLNITEALNENRIKHIFKNQEHNLDRLGLSYETTYEKVTEALLLKDRYGFVPYNKPFEIRVNVDGHVLEVRGIIIKGELNYGTFFIPE